MNAAWLLLAGVLLIAVGLRGMVRFVVLLLSSPRGFFEALAITTMIIMSLAGVTCGLILCWTGGQL